MYCLASHRREQEKKYFVHVYRYLFLFQWGNIMSHLHYSLSFYCGKYLPEYRVKILLQQQVRGQRLPPRGMGMGAEIYRGGPSCALPETSSGCQPRTHADWPTELNPTPCCNNKCCWYFNRSWFLLPCHSYLGIYSHFFLKHCTFCRDFILFDSDIFCGCAFHPLAVFGWHREIFFKKRRMHVWSTKRDLFAKPFYGWV